MTDKLFKRELIERHSLRFRNMSIGEDGVFFAEFIRQNPPCAVFLKTPLYHYTIDDSLTLSVSYHKERESDNFRLSNTMRQTVEARGLLQSDMHARMLKYCTIRDLQLGIKNINLSGKTFREKCAWLKAVMRDTQVRQSVSDTPISMLASRNDKIKLLLIKLRMYRTVIYISALNN